MVKLVSLPGLWGLSSISPFCLDATVPGFLANVAAHPWDSPLTRRLQGHANWVRYVERGRAEWWSRAPAAEVDEA